MIFNMAVS
ncbi:hypothetical protein CGLO_14082 [Colletotrichum gloeosporioides Cg-14]|uniref:Uncharacterized protein n=1 Tax=Colletotrichum gloeosporioides (strain Cg-14) TaxID=1237896 RepID=T0K4J5_COLGC|nr:hypothetical protein CGLO_14082 [Colletotrichum gloeosporioides Cg-14]